jgi:ribonuclease PH
MGFGNTQVICTASIDEQAPRWRQGSGSGWVTAEYGMLPGSTPDRKSRDRGGKVDSRSVEIQRLIGRSLRSVIDLDALGEITVWVDCDVLQADGGTRTAAITGGYIALHQALAKRHKADPFERWPLVDTVAAVSVGIVDGVSYLDLDYALDSTAEVDMNVVMTGSGAFVEVQGTAEGKPFSRRQLDTLLKLAEGGIEELTKTQRNVLKIKT